MVYHKTIEHEQKNAKQQEEDKDIVMITVEHFLSADYFCAYAPDLITCSTNMCVYPISLSYHAPMLTKSPSMTFVSERSMRDAYCMPMISEDTNGSIVVLNTP